MSVQLPPPPSFYTERQLRDKLRQGEYPQDVIEEAVAYVKSYGYVDDRKYYLRYLHVCIPCMIIRLPPPVLPLLAFPAV